MRRHPLLPRIAAVLGGLIVLAGLAALARYTPPLPHISSITGPFTATVLRDLLLGLAWLLSIYILLVLLARASHVVLRGPAWQREHVLPGVIPKPATPRPPVPLAERFQPPFKLTLTPRPDQGAASASPPAAGQADTPVATKQPTPRPRKSQPTEPAPSISVLGPLQINASGRPPKRVPTRELTAYLALHPNGASRDELIEALWPGQDPNKTWQRLWESASDARAALGDAEPRTLEAALALWRGEPLQGSDYAWADGHIHRLHATLIGLLERTGNARLEQGDAQGALELAEQAITLDQFHEASWRLALQADYVLGLRESITRRYDDIAKALDQQLGLQPTRETRAMYRELLGQA